MFANNPLFEVVWQASFPTILRVETEIPAAFQDAVRQVFPRFERQMPPNMPHLPDEVAEALAGSLPRPTHIFEDDQEENQIVLTSESIAVVCTNYVEWERLKSQILMALNTLIDVYRPAYFDRIGLRYRNLIKRSKIGLDNEPWSELLNPAVAGELTQPGWAKSVSGIQKSITIDWPETEDVVRFQHGLVTAGDPEISYILDFDYIANKRTEVEDVDRVTERLHGYSGSAFQWAIADKLKLALD